MSDSKADISRNNGAKGNGPVTEEGKARSSQNAMKFGIFSRKLLLPEESQAEYDELYSALLDEYCPTTPTEIMLLDRLMRAIWRRFRVLRAENGATTIERNRFAFAPEFTKWVTFGALTAGVSSEMGAVNSRQDVIALRDSVVNESLSISQHFERFSKLLHSLDREIDATRRMLIEEKARRIGSLPNAAPRNGNVRRDSARRRVVDLDLQVEHDDDVAG